MKNRVYFVRHGQNHANLHHILSHKLVDFKLTALGEKQALQTAAFFADKAIDKIYSSPLIRAFQTGRAIQQTTGAPMEVIEILREVNIGSLEHTPIDENAWQTHDWVYEEWIGGNKEARFPDGESYLELAARFEQMLLQTLPKHDGEELVFAGHGGIFLIGPKATFPKLFDQSNFVRMDNCGIGILDVTLEDGELSAEMVDWNYTGHLNLAVPEIRHPVGISEFVNVDRN